MSESNYSQLFADALADVESGLQHPCGTTEHCCAMGGCPRCFRGVMHGDLGIERVEVFTHSGTIRIITAGHVGRPCVVSFRGVPLTVHK
jgi:hypothetical protein